MYMHEHDLTFNNRQWLICRKNNPTKPKQTACLEVKELRSLYI